MVGAVIVVGIAGVLAVVEGGGPTRQGVQNAGPLIPSAKPNEPKGPSPAMTATAVTPPEHVVAATSSSKSKATEFDALVKSGKPADAFAAFKLLHSCSLEPQACGDLTAGQRTQSYQLLNQAVAAHLPKAAVYLLITTPDGRAPYEVYGDPAYDAWRADARRAITEAADAGDTAALSQMAELAFQDHMPTKALMYWTAYVDRSPGMPKELVDQRAEQLAQGLSAERVAAAVAGGHAFASRRQN